jgi:hypothetical protein
MFGDPISLLFPIFLGITSAALVVMAVTGIGRSIFAPDLVARTVAFIPSNCFSKSKQRTNHGHLYLPMDSISVPHDRNSPKGRVFRKKPCVPTSIGVSARRLSKWLPSDLIRLKGRDGCRLPMRAWNSNSKSL